MTEVIGIMHYFYVLVSVCCRSGVGHVRVTEIVAVSIIAALLFSFVVGLVSVTLV